MLRLNHPEVNLEVMVIQYWNPLNFVLSVKFNDNCIWIVTL